MGHEMTMSYAEFIARKTQASDGDGFEPFGSAVADGGSRSAQ